MPMMPETFKTPGRPGRKAARKEADKRRGSARARGYSAKWDRAAKAFKSHNPLCLGCQAVGRVTATAVVDHTIPHKGDMKIFWHRDGWQPSCRWHHDVVKQRLERLWSQGKIAADQLRLDSPKAIELTRLLDPTQ